MDSLDISLPILSRRWAYFLCNQQLIDTFKHCGRQAGDLDPQNTDHLHYARRAIFERLTPGRVQVWLAKLDEQPGMVFFVGRAVPDILKSISPDLTMSCKDVFKRPPTVCKMIANKHGMEWDLYSRNRTVHWLRLSEFLQSDRDGDEYPPMPMGSARALSRSTTLSYPLDSAATHSKTMTYRWAYFCGYDQLVQLYKDCGGQVGNFNPESPADIHHARRAAVEYILPGRIQAWLARLENYVGIVFFVGEPVRDLGKAMSVETMESCEEMFSGHPNVCKVEKGSQSLKWDFFMEDGMALQLRLVELLYCDREGDMYPRTREEVALFRLRGLVEYE